MSRIPTLFISHGAPSIVIDTDNSTHRFLKTLADKLPRPKAIVVFSAHWQSRGIKITGTIQPEQIYDFGGFAKELYDFKYAPQSDLELANKIENSLNDAGYAASLDDERGFDHGVWAPLALIYPKGDIPVVQVSLPVNEGAEFFYRVGKNLEWLRDEDVLVIGSGNITHNLREAFKGTYKETPKWVNDFADWVNDKLQKNDINALLNWRTEAPASIQNHPTDEHFLPIFSALGAAGENVKTERLHNDVDLGVLRMDAFTFS